MTDFVSDDDRSESAAPRHLPAPANDQKAALHARIERDFVYHAPKGDQPERYVKLREEARAYAHTLVDLVPVGRELSLALSKLEEAVFHANSGIARESADG